MYGFRWFLKAAEKRLLDLCAGGATFLMYDGNFWNGGCLNPDHSHSVPYTFEDHVRANVDLAARIRAKYPFVFIEMHDMIAGGSPIRHTPLYYTYGLPGSSDENWGLRGDNTDAIVLWWYASTCRHLGIGGTAKDPAVVAAQKAAMKRYRVAEGLYKRGEFYGISEEIHVHALGNRVAVNAFNLDDRARTIEGNIRLASSVSIPPAPMSSTSRRSAAWRRSSSSRQPWGPGGAKMASVESR